MASAAMMPRESETASNLFRLPGDNFTSSPLRAATDAPQNRV